jgi:isoamylase
MDVLRYWLTDMHVDGFRLDTPSVQGLTESTPSPNPLEDFPLVDFMTVLRQDPVVGRVKLIGHGWYPSGFDVLPDRWSDHHDQYQEAIRDTWRITPVPPVDLVEVWLGSGALFHPGMRPRSTPLIAVATHDGFTLTDPVSYNEKHNEANGQDNRDGQTDNRSWNGGVEGPSDDPAIVAVRDRQRRNFLTTLFLSRGIPLISHGDELGRTQAGNNHAYAQDNEITWIDWSRVDEPLLAYTRALISFRREHPVLRRQRWLDTDDLADPSPEVRVFTPDGTEITASLRDIDASAAGVRVAIWLDGQPRGDEPTDQDLLILINASEDEARFRLPGRHLTPAWQRHIDTVDLTSFAADHLAAAGSVCAVPPNSMTVLGGFAGFGG